MAKITRGDAPQGISQANISEGVAAQSGAGLAAIGQEMQRTGRGIQQSDAGGIARQMANQVEQFGREYWEQSKRTHQTAVLTNNITDATKEYEEAIFNRKQQVVDKDGNPTFTTLGEDVRKIGEDIAEKYASKIIDPEVASKFRNDFTRFTGSKQISAMKTARRQQISFAKVSLDKGLGSLLTQGIQDGDIDNLTTYESQAHALIDDALTGGLVNPEEHAALKQQFSTSVREGAFSQQIQKDTVGAANILQASAGELGISEEAKASLTKELEAKVGSDILEADKIAEQAIRDEMTAQGNLAKEVERRIKADAIREDELLRQESKLLPSSFKQLKKQFIAQSKKRRKQDQKLNEVSIAISTGDSLDNFSGSVVKEHFNREVERQEAQVGRPVNMSEKAEIASVYNKALPTYAKELNHRVLSGNPDTAQDALEAYVMLRDTESRALEGNSFTNKAEAVAETAELLIEKAGVEPSLAIKQARNQIANIDENTLNSREKEFSSLDDFKLNNLEETTADEVGAENFFGLNKKVEDSSAQTFKQLAREAYKLTGDADSAKKIAASQMNKTHGLSEFNGEEVYMFAPPEKLFPGIDPSLLRTSLEAEVTPVLPEGVSAEGVQIFADSKTLNTFSYALSAKRNIDGVEIDLPLVNPETGELLRWFPDIEGIATGQEEVRQQQRERFVREAREERQERIDAKPEDKAMDLPGLL